MELEARWKWKLDGSGSSMEVEARWNWKLDGSGSTRKWKPVGNHIFTIINYSRWLMLRLCFGRACRLQCTMHVPSIESMCSDKYFVVNSSGALTDMAKLLRLAQAKYSKTFLYPHAIQ